jgi:hypothetical protein
VNTARIRAKALEMQAEISSVKRNGEIKLKFSVQLKWNHIMGNSHNTM